MKETDPNYIDTVMDEIQKSIYINRQDTNDDTGRMHGRRVEQPQTGQTININVQPVIHTSSSQTTNSPLHEIGNLLSSLFGINK